MTGKRILMITSKYPSNVSTFITRDMQILVEAGYEIDICPITPLNEEYWKFIPQEGKKLIDEGKIRVINYPKSKIIKNLFKLWNYPKGEFFDEITQILKESKEYGKNQFAKSIYALIWTLTLLDEKGDTEYDRVISYWSNYSATAAYLFSKYSTTKPLFITYSHAGVDLYRDQIYLIEKFKAAHKIITVCQFNVDFIKELYPDKFDSIKEKIEIYHLPLKIKEVGEVKKEPNQIIAVSTLNRRKGINYLIDACGELLKDDVEFRLLIIGGGEEEENLKNQAKALGLEDRTTFTGQIPYEDVENYMKKSVVLAHCSPELGDAVPTVIKESLMVGTPVVGSDIVGIPELLNYGRCGLLFEPKNSHDLAHKLKTILLDETLQKEMSQKGREFAKKMFDIEKNGKYLVDIVES